MDVRCHVSAKCQQLIIYYILSLQEARANRLAEELGAAQAREAQLQAKMQAEIKRLSSEIDSVKEAYQLEVKYKTELALAFLLYCIICVFSSTQFRLTTQISKAVEICPRPLWLGHVLSACLLDLLQTEQKFSTPTLLVLNILVLHSSQ